MAYKAVAAVLVLVLVGIGLYYFYFISVPAPENRGRIVFAISDAATDLSSISSIKVTIDRAQIHSSTRGWIDISTILPQTFDLIQLKAEGSSKVLSDTTIEEGDYQQLRLHVSSVTVTDANGTAAAKMPSEDIMISSDVVVVSNSTSTVSFDFLADESLHVTGNGRYILAPVINLQARHNASAVVGSDGQIDISGGTVDADERVGMDVNGNVGAGIGIDSNANLSIGTNGSIMINLSNIIG